MKLVDFFRLQFRRPVSATLQSFGEAAVSTSLDSNREEEAASNQLQPPAAAAVTTKNGGDLEEHVALADFAAEDASQVSFKKGDQVFVKTRDESGTVRILILVGRCHEIHTVALCPGPFPYCMLKLHDCGS